MIIVHKRQINHIQGGINVVINEGNIQRVDEVQYSGANVDENLNWNRQHKKLKSKLKRGLSELRKLRNMLPQLKLDQVYRAPFESHLRYGNELWGSLSATKLKHLQRLQDSSLELIEGAKYREGCKCNWLCFKLNKI